MGSDVALGTQPEPQTVQSSAVAPGGTASEQASALERLVQDAISEQGKLCTSIRSYPLAAEDEPALVFRP